jgi:hypothetical protein
MSGPTEGNLNATNPAAPSGKQNCSFQASAPYIDTATGLQERDISAYPQPATASLEGTIILAKDIGGTSDLPEVVGVQGIPIAGSGPSDGYVPTYVSASSNIQWKAGGGTPSPTIQSSNNGIAESTSAFAMKGNLVVPTQNITVSYVFGNIYGNSGDVYQCLIYSITGTSTIATIVATSSTYTFGSTFTGPIAFNMGAVALTAGTTYAIVFQITSGTSTTPCQIDIPATPWECVGFKVLSGSVSIIRSANVSPTTGTTLSTSTGGNACALNLVVSP